MLPDPRVPPTFLSFNNNKQLGAGITLSHTLTPVINLNGTLDAATTTKDSARREGLKTRQGLASLQGNWQMSLRDTLFVGTRYQYQKNKGTLSSSATASEAAIFTGLFHSFGSIGAR